MKNQLIKEMFGTKRDVKRTLNNMEYAKEIGIKDYAIWDFVSQPYEYIFNNLKKGEFKTIQKEAYEVLLEKLTWFRNFFKK